MPDNTTELRQQHTPEAIESRLEHGNTQSYLRDFVYGAVDGTVTTFAIVAGAAGAGLSSGVILVLGVANLIADGFSMAASNFLGIRADAQLREQARRDEYREIELFPEGELEEIRQIFAGKGFEGETLDRVVSVITSNKDQWVDTMLKEELGMSLRGPSPLRGAMITFVAFVSVGAVPLLVYLCNILFGDLISAPFFWSSVFTAVAFFSIGAAKSTFVAERWYTSGLETLGLGGVAAGLAYLIGNFLRSLAQ